MDRLEAHAAVSRALAAQSDDALAALVEEARPLHAGIGGTSRLLTVSGARVFVKLVPLTDIEREPAHVRSTANLFDLPLFCQYGLGGCPGFGAWRELEAHLLATDWAVTGACESFPLLHHWRVLARARPGPMDAAEREALERDVHSWEDSPAVRRRIEAVRDASAHLVLFGEYVPQNLLEWATGRFERGERATEEALEFIESGLPPTNAFMEARGFVHFDVHFENVLTDGRVLRFGDFGLASSPTFDLAPEERLFLARHATYDRGRAAVGFLHCLAAGFLGKDDWKARVHRHLAGEGPAVPPSIAAAIERVAPAALLFLEFSRALREESKRTPYPEDRMRRLLDGA